MQPTSICLMGAGLVLVGGRPRRVRSVKTLGLLAYLVLEDDRAHLRSRLAALLWPDVDGPSARHSLRQCLFWLRSPMGAALASSLSVDGDLLRFVPDESVRIDIARAQARLDGAAPDSSPERPGQRAILLEGRQFPCCDEFTAWLDGWRQALSVAAGRPSLPLPRTDRAALPDPGRGASLEPVGSVDGLMLAARAAARAETFGSALILVQRALELLSTEPSVDPLADGRIRFELLLFKESMLDRLGCREDQAGVIAILKDLVAVVDQPAMAAQAWLRDASLSAYTGSDNAALLAGLEALRLFRLVADLPGEAEARRELSFWHWRVGDHAQAIGEARAALALHRQLGDLHGEATALHNLGEIMIGLGSPGQAMPLFDQAMALHWSLGHRIGEVLTCFGIARALRRAGSTQAASERYRQALALARRHGERIMQARALHAMACLAVETGDLDEALSLIGRAINLDRAINYAHALGHDLADLAIVHAMRREGLQARAALTESLVWFESVRDASAISATRARLHDLAAGRWEAFRFEDRLEPIKSHLQLAEGKVYCAFESSLAGN